MTAYAGLTQDALLLYGNSGHQRVNEFAACVQDYSCFSFLAQSY